VEGSQTTRWSSLRLEARARFARQKSTIFFPWVTVCGSALRQHGFEPQEDTQQGEKHDQIFGTGFVLAVCVSVLGDVQGPAGRRAEETPAEALAEKRRKVGASGQQRLCLSFLVALLGTRKQRWSKGSPESQYQCGYSRNTAEQRSVCKPWLAC